MNIFGGFNLFVDIGGEGKASPLNCTIFVGRFKIFFKDKINIGNTFEDA